MMTTPWDKLREECGVFGIRTQAAAAPYVHLGLYALQHRGQESAGIATWDGSHTHLVKDMGLVAQVFTPERLARLPGGVGIGHVRYSTMGGAHLANAQPFIEETPWGTLALAHNGNLVNAPMLRAGLEDAGCEFHATSATCSAPTWSKAQLSEAKTTSFPRRPIASGRMPCASRNAISVSPTSATAVYAPRMRSMQ